MERPVDEIKELDYKIVCEYLYDGIHITDNEGRVLYVNKAYTRTTGIQPEEILGRRVADIEAAGVYQGAVTPKVLATGKRVNSVATIHSLHKEVLVTGTPVFDSAGKVKLVVTNTRDITELKQL
jgi:PAS domain S-box-containing protein